MQQARRGDSAQLRRELMIGLRWAGGEEERSMAGEHGGWGAEEDKWGAEADKWGAEEDKWGGLEGRWEGGSKMTARQ